MNKTFLLLAAAFVCATSPTMQAQPLVNLGLVGVGRLPADSFDLLAPGADTLGGVFSGLWLDPASLTKTGNTYTATLYGLPDRGFGDGLQDYHPRIERLSFSITPYDGPGPVAQDQITFANTGTLLLSVGGNLFTGANPDDTNFASHPQTLASGIGLGKWSLDPEGIARAGDGTYYVSDEYGPFLYHFNAAGELTDVLMPPDAYAPKIGPAFPRVTNYLAASTIATNDSGRYINRGLEGLSITPSGKRLVTALQSPLVQNGLSRNPSRNTRILIYDIDPLSPTYHQPVAEYVHVLPLSAAEANNRHTPVSEILALSETRFLILQRDSRGLGGDAGALLYKRIVSVDVSAATNLLGTGYDLEKGAPGQLSLPRAGLPSNVVAATSRDLVDLLLPAQLAKFGLNLAATNQNANTICEKWEGLAVVPLGDPAAPNDYLLLVGNDNDFKASVVYHNGQPVGTNAFTVDMMLLAFRIGEDHLPPTVTCPTTIVRVPASTNCSLPNVTGFVTGSDNSAPPVRLTQTPPPGSPVALDTPVTVSVTATDAAGNNSTPCSFTVTVFDGPPSLTCPGAITLAANSNCVAVLPNLLTNTIARDNCSAVTLAQSPVAGTIVGLGLTDIIVTATDAANNTVTCSTKLTVADRTPPALVCPPPRTLTAGPNCQAAVPNLIPKVTDLDNCYALVTVTQAPPAGTLIGLGTNLVTLIAVDPAGNTNTCPVLVTVVDRRAPGISRIVASPSELVAGGRRLIPVTLTVTASDICDPAPRCRIVSVKRSGKSGESDKTGKPDWSITGDLTLNLRADEAGRTYRIAVQCTDAAGNSASRSITLRVVRDHDDDEDEDDDDQGK